MKITVSRDKGTNGVLGDPLATSRILQNLVSNAIRHSGGSAININVSDDQITVSDDGGGMDQTTLDRIPTPNVTSDGGLGLVNCISLAQSTGATIRFATTPHNGFSAILSFAP
jgi:signal transduction histidine kinase